MNSSSSSHAIFGGCRKRDADAGAKWRSFLDENIFVRVAEEMLLRHFLNLATFITFFNTLFSFP